MTSKAPQVKSPQVTFPRISQILESRKDIVKLLRSEFVDQVPERILIVTGPKATKAFAEVYRSIIEKEWQKMNVSMHVLTAPPDVRGVDDLTEEITRKGVPPDLIVYVGAQTVADSTKAVVAGLRERFKDNNIVFGGIITGLSGDGVFSGTASLRDADGIPVSKSAVAPDFIVGNKLTLLTEPYEMKSSCVGDILSKISSLWDYNYSCQVLNKYHNDFAADLTKTAFDSLLGANIPDKYFLHSPDSIDKLFRAVQLCGLSMQVAGSSETCSGSEHVGEKWLQEFIIRSKKNNVDLRTPSHGAALTPMVITTLYMQGQAEKAERVKAIAEKVGLPCSARKLGLSARVLQLCLALGFGYRCPRYVAYMLGDAESPEGKNTEEERVTVLEQVEFKVLLDAIRQAMVDSGVGEDGDFQDLDQARFGAMREIAQAALAKIEREITTKVDHRAAQKVCDAMKEFIVRGYH